MGHRGIWETPVTVTVSETAITGISVPTDRTQFGDTEKIFEACRERLFPRIIEAQSYAVDAITGATISSMGVEQAVHDALVQALEAGGSDASAVEAFNVVPRKPKRARSKKWMSTSWLSVWGLSASSP